MNAPQTEDKKVSYKGIVADHIHAGIKCYLCKDEPIVGARFIPINKKIFSKEKSYCQKCAEIFSDKIIMLKLSTPIPSQADAVNQHEEEAEAMVKTLSDYQPNPIRR